MSSKQQKIRDSIFDLPVEDQQRALLRWALARLTYYGPSDDACATAIREFLDGPGQEVK